MIRVPQKRENLGVISSTRQPPQQTIAELLEMSDQSISYHLKVLEKIDLISREHYGLGKLVVMDEELRLFLLDFI